MNSIADRFPQRIENHRVDRDEDGYPCIEVEMSTCECGVELPLELLHMVDDGTPRPLFLCEPCLEEFNRGDAECPCELPGHGYVYCPEHHRWLDGAKASVLAPALVPTSFTRSDYDTQNHNAEVA